MAPFAEDVDDCLARLDADPKRQNAVMVEALREYLEGYKLVDTRPALAHLEALNAALRGMSLNSGERRQRGPH